MAEHDSGQERTEEATPKRRQEARDKGQIARSKELGTAAVLLAAAGGFMLTGPSLAQALDNIMSRVFTLSREQVFDVNQMFLVWHWIGEVLAWPLLSFIVLLALLAFAGNVLLGGMNFSAQAMLPKGNRMDPLKGFKRMFGVQALVELGKGLAKFSVVALAAFFLLRLYFDEILSLSQEHLPGNIYHALDLLMWLFLLLCSSVIVIVVIDVPFQLWNHNKQLRMTQQEVKDEFKDTEGKPEVKSRVRQLQRELAQRRMMSDVPSADVIVVNPEHYAVAIKYDPVKSPAPYVVAKGIDSVAFQIRAIGRDYNIAIVSAPPLARAIYHTTKLSQQIPDGLFTAVAQVLAYVFQLKQYQQGRGAKPKPIP